MHSVKRFLGRPEALLGAVVAGVMLIFGVMSPYFFTLPNLVDLVESYSVTTILAAGVFVVLVSGGIDISFAAVASATQYLAAVCAVKYGMPPIVAIPLACALGISLGCVNALLTFHLQIASIIVTIATSSIFYGLLIYLSDGREIYNLPGWWTDRVDFLAGEVSGEVVRLTLPVVVTLVVVVITHHLMSRTHAGRQVYALGGNPEAAKRLGISVLRVQLFVYGYLGLLAGVAGFVQAHRVKQVVPTAMFGQELAVLAVAILGGASLVGGVGSMGGVILGVLLLAVLQNGLSLMGVSPYFFQVVIGLAIILSTCAAGYSAQRRQLRREGFE